MSVTVTFDIWQKCVSSPFSQLNSIYSKYNITLKIIKLADITLSGVYNQQKLTSGHINKQCSCYTRAYAMDIYGLLHLYICPTYADVHSHLCITHTGKHMHTDTHTCTRAWF